MHVEEWVNEDSSKLLSIERIRGYAKVRRNFKKNGWQFSRVSKTKKLNGGLLG
ncbi:hypothetical protein Goklo_003033 [Gossypium klotzschianum]|uniref:Uncharacterized protein n=1 Tax=Gossypium klotzschianum TaxID=34286 RepID=A0A7J8VW36_9ROSI|nr:hypothetical protein [Gossypium klotzschianum]